ncbi:MAG: class I SAM-dependent methyltransferase, partial [Prevotellaceae bacterium]|nr:class I SAM-dependent methyltransferase [Prevotellaceae bacterium]
MKKKMAQDYDLNYFHRRESRNEKFWNRFGGKPDLRNKVVLDVGCGHGSMCFYMAQSGAKKVIGVDIDAGRISFAKKYLELHYPQYAKVVEFYDLDLKKYSNQPQFDYIISVDSFEHIIDLPGMIEEMKLRLKPGGIIYTGFGPLYNDFYGDHKRTKCGIPWGHVICSDERIIKRLNRQSIGQSITSIYDLGLNKLSLSDYRKIF